MIEDGRGLGVEQARSRRSFLDANQTRELRRRPRAGTEPSRARTAAPACSSRSAAFARSRWCEARIPSSRRRQSRGGRRSSAESGGGGPRPRRGGTGSTLSRRSPASTARSLATPHKERERERRGRTHLLLGDADKVALLLVLLVLLGLLPPLLVARLVVGVRLALAPRRILGVALALELHERLAVVLVGSQRAVRLVGESEKRCARRLGRGRLDAGLARCERGR